MSDPALDFAIRIQQLVNELQIFPQLEARVDLPLFQGDHVSVRLSLIHSVNAAPDTFTRWTAHPDSRATFNLPVHPSTFDEDEFVLRLVAAQVTLLEHEVFEHFRFRGERYFRPHFDAFVDGVPSGSCVRFHHHLESITIVKAHELTYIANTLREAIA